MIPTKRLTFIVGNYFKLAATGFTQTRCCWMYGVKCFDFRVATPVFISFFCQLNHNDPSVYKL